MFPEVIFDIAFYILFYTLVVGIPCFLIYVSYVILKIKKEETE